MESPSGNPAPGNYGNFSHKCQDPEATAACGKEAMTLEPSDMGRFHDKRNKRPSHEKTEKTNIYYQPEKAQSKNGNIKYCSNCGVPGKL